MGTSGAGKSTLARELAKRLAVPYVELDALMHQPGWTPRPDAEFMDEVEKATSWPGWVVDGNYMRFVIEGPVWRRADTVVWLDLPRRTVMRQLIARTVRRAVTREVTFVRLRSHAEARRWLESIVPSAAG